MPKPFLPFAVPPDSYLQDAAFTHDGQTLYLTRIDGAAHTIVVTTLAQGSWTPPKVASISGRWRDLGEVLSPDGRTMIFASNRPAAGDSKPIDADFGNKLRPGRGGNLWSTTWTGSAWSEPARLPDAVNANTSTFSPAVTADGTLYFMRSYGPKATFHLFVSKLEQGAYQSSRLAPFSDPAYTDFDPTVAPDGSFIIFSSTRPPSRPGTADLFIAYYRNGSWTKAVDMGTGINPAGDAIEARLSPNLRTLYYTSSMDLTHPYASPAPNAPSHLWSVDVSRWTVASQ